MDDPVAQAVAAVGVLLADKEGVAGYGEGETDDGGPCVVVMLEYASQEVLDALPESVEGIPVRVTETGSIHAYETESGPGVPRRGSVAPPAPEKAYVIVVPDVSDETVSASEVDRAAQTVVAHRGRLLAHGAPAGSGGSPGARIIVAEFPDMAAAKRWHDATDRQSQTVQVLIVDGLPEEPASPPEAP